MFQIRNLPVEIDDLLIAVRRFPIEFHNLPLFAACSAPQFFVLFAQALIRAPEILEQRGGDSLPPTKQEEVLESMPDSKADSAASPFDHVQRPEATDSVFRAGREG